MLISLFFFTYIHIKFDVQIEMLLSTIRKNKLNSSKFTEFNIYFARINEML